MTRLDYVKTMSAEELVNYVFTIMIPEGKKYSHSILGLIEWLNKPIIEIELNDEKQILSQLVRG